MRTIAIGTLVLLGALAAGCDDGSGGDSGTETEAPPPVGGSPREGDTPPVENPTAEALEACGYPAGRAVPPAGTDEATMLDDCLRAIRGYPDPLYVPLDLVRASLALRA
ncbi:MAG: hypothetical protein ACRDY6_08310 [Acidimicrobiia bacterium]